MQTGITQCAMWGSTTSDFIAAAGAGKFVSPYYDSMIAQVIVHAADREAATAKLIDYLARVRITGICTNIPLLKQILTDSVFVDGQYDTDYLPGLLRRIDSDQLIAEINAGAGDATGGIEQVFGQGAQAGTDFDDRIPRLGIDRIDDLLDHALVVEKVLSKTFTGTMTLMCFHRIALSP